MSDESAPLEARPEQLRPAPTRQDQGLSATSVSYVLFAAGGVDLAAPLDNIRAVRPLPKITWLPRAPAWLRGVAALEDELISVVDFAALIGAPKALSPASARHVSGPISHGALGDRFPCGFGPVRQPPAAASG